MRYWDDFHVGQTFDLGSVTIDGDEMVQFAERFDPQPFHVDPVAAKDTPFGGLIASGWFTGSIFMRLYVDAVLVDSASQGSPGMSELRWLSPVRAGDVLTGRLTVLDVAPSSTKQDRGTVFLRGELLRDGEPVVTTTFRGLFGRRPPQSL
jgi:acyl dehydratase